MGWKNDLLDASFRGVPFSALSVADKTVKALAVHEYPGRPGAYLQDMGRGARRIPVRAAFWGPEYRSGLEALVRALEQDGPGELIHPVFGAVQAGIAAWEILHSAERPDYAAVEFEAVECALDAPFFQASSVQSTADNARLELETQFARIEPMAAAMAEDALAGLRSLPVETAAAALARLASILDVYDPQAQAGRCALGYDQVPAAFVPDLQAAQALALAPLRALPNAAEKDGNPEQARRGFIAFSRVSDALPRLPLLSSEKFFRYPSGAGAFSAPYAFGAGAPAVSLPAARHDAAAASAIPPLSRGVAVAVAVAMLLQTRSFLLAAGSMLRAEAERPTLAPQDIETVCGNARMRLQDCLLCLRSVWEGESGHALSECLRDAARHMQDLGKAALRAQPPLTEYVAPRECNFHILAHDLYKDYARAAELRRLNPQVRNPNFIALGQRLLAYAQ